MRGLALPHRNRQPGKRFEHQRRSLTERCLVIRQTTAGDDLLDPRRDLALPVRRQIREQMVLDVSVEAAVKDPEVGPIPERHLLLEDPHQGRVEFCTAQKVSRSADLAPVVLIARLVRARIGEDLGLARVVLNGDEKEDAEIACGAADVVGQHGRQESGAHRSGLCHQPALGVGERDADRCPQSLARPEPPSLNLSGDVGDEKRGQLGEERGGRTEKNQLHRMMPEPVLGRLATQNAVAEIVVLADDVGVGVVAFVVHDLPLGGVDVEIPVVAIRVVLPVARQVVVAAVQDVVAQLGELQQPVQHLQHHRAAGGLRATVAQQLQPAGVDRLAVSSDRADVRQVCLAHLRPRLQVEGLQFVGQAGRGLLRRYSGGRHDMNSRGRRRPG